MKRHYTNFNSYTLEDFIADKGFILWAIQPSEETNSYWLQVLKDYPQKAALISEAKTLINAMQFRKEEMSPNESELLWKSILSKTKAKPKRRFIPTWLRGVAAAALLGITISIAFFYYSSYQKLVITTDYGQMRTVDLPDGTHVKLNAHSEIKYNKNWDKDHIREVWISGEAFFNVSHLHHSGKVTDGQRFIVHTKGINIEVLGTRFNVKQRRESVKVVLVSGKVSMGIAAQGNPIIMKPGELAEYAESKNLIVKSKVREPDLPSWKDGELHFEKTSASEAFQYIEDTYGYKIVFANPEIANKKLSGTFATSSEQALFKALSKTLGITIQKDPAKKELIIKN